MCRGSPRAGPDPSRRSRGSTEGLCARSSQRLLVGPVGPGRERLAVGTLGRVPAGQPLDGVVELGRGGLETAQLATEVGAVAPGHGEAAAQVHLEALDHLTVRAGYQLALEP